MNRLTALGIVVEACTARNVVIVQEGEPQMGIILDAADSLGARPERIYRANGREEIAFYTDRSGSGRVRFVRTGRGSLRGRTADIVVLIGARARREAMEADAHLAVIADGGEVISI